MSDLETAQHHHSKHIQPPPNFLNSLFCLGFLTVRLPFIRKKKKLVLFSLHSPIRTENPNPCTLARLRQTYSWYLIAIHTHFGPPQSV